MTRISSVLKCFAFVFILLVVFSFFFIQKVSIATVTVDLFILIASLYCLLENDRFNDEYLERRFLFMRKRIFLRDIERIQVFKERIVVKATVNGKVYISLDFMYERKKLDLFLSYLEKANQNCIVEY